jgi:A/G-specific adenine glycosylase
LPALSSSTGSAGRRGGTRGPRAAARLAAALLAWYDRHRRTLPWRAAPGIRADPYRVWLSEVMLQQTTVVAVAPYYRDFLARWPTVAALAAAPVEDVMAAWAGLGYYARARNLHACAKAVAAAGGEFPDSEDGLRALPGIGAYTAAAVAAIAFGRRAVVVDGNVERVVARLFAVEQALPAAKPALRALAASLTPEERAGDYAQAAMDLGATICTPRKPRCMLCPWRTDCAGRAAPERYPAKAAERQKPLRSAAAFFVTRADGAIWLRRRPPSGLLGGMLEVPSAPWRDGAWDDARGAEAAPMGLDFTMLPGMVRHGFTHFALELKVFAARSAKRQAGQLAGEWWPVDRLGEAALPSLMRKVVAHGLKGQG